MLINKYMCIRKIILFSVVLSIKCYSSICYFTPPENWKCADPKNLSEYVQIGFIGKGNSSFNPSINFATEKTDISLSEYVKAIKNAHKNQKNVVVREMGKIKTQINVETILIEINKKSPFGDIRLLQTITKKDDDIFILTGSVLKDEFLKFKDSFFQAFKSLKLTDDLLSEVIDKDISINLITTVNDLKQKKISLKNFEKHLENNYNDLGSYWKILVLKQAYETTSNQ